MTDTSAEGPVQGAAEVSDARPNARGTLMVGLPRTGKTSYLGLLFVEMVRGSGGTLRLDTFDQEHSYLNLVAQQLLQFTPADHTQTDHQEGLDLTVRLPDDRTITIYVPDLSGETWQIAHVERILPSDLSQRFAQVDGFMLFSHVGEFVASTTISETKAAALEVGTTEDEWREGADPVEEQGDSPTQVALVDLIQVMQERRDGPFSLSLILSAFDLARGSKADISPRQWLEMNLPLLDQFLAAQAAVIDCRIYGVSAQGGAYAVADRDEAAPIEGVAPDDQDLLERAYVLDDAGERVEIFAPLLWALGDG